MTLLVALTVSRASESEIYTAASPLRVIRQWWEAMLLHLLNLAQREAQHICILLMFIAEDPFTSKSQD